MITDQLYPDLNLLREEYVLVQAWKKTAAYIRYHNWFSDTLALDWAAVNLPRFISELRERLDSSETWQTDSLRIVPAPKSQKWHVKDGVWEPDKDSEIKLRPLAHVSLVDQVVATAVMLCLADRVESLQGSTRVSLKNEQSRKQLISYGNRLFCDEVDGRLHHRWGSTKLYRAYFQDYRSFLERPTKIAYDLRKADDKRRIYIVHADLRQFYDRVSPELFERALKSICKVEEERNFVDFTKSVLCWHWDSDDQGVVESYSKNAGREDFTHTVLPQGLVASGFFSNVVLLAFDNTIRQSIGSHIDEGICIEDACRYVDDLRITVSLAEQSDFNQDKIRYLVYSWLENNLEISAPGLTLSEEKTKIAAFGSDDRPLIRQSLRMQEIQTAVSGGFDAIEGEDILNRIEGLMRPQDSLGNPDESGWRLSPVTDVRDETVARFGAARFRTTFRSIRPLFESDVSEKMNDPEMESTRKRTNRTQRSLDEDARVFALGLIHRWVQDPSNVRLLRIGLDLWPDVIVLREVLHLLRRYTGPDQTEVFHNHVALYCLSEILRAGATETGVVSDVESLPSDIDLPAYRQELCDEAKRLLSLSQKDIPWYLRQQALLCLAVFNPESASVLKYSVGKENYHYNQLIRFLGDKKEKLCSADFATLAVLSRRSFCDRKKSVTLVQSKLNTSRFQEIAERDPSFMRELLEDEVGCHFKAILPESIRKDWAIDSNGSDIKNQTLASIVLQEHPTGSLRNELSILRFSILFLDNLQNHCCPEIITPGQVCLKLNNEQGIADIQEMDIVDGSALLTGVLYQAPDWCTQNQRWRYQLGYLLRFILSGQPDFTRPIRPIYWKERELSYRSAESHWYQRLYGFFNGQQAFGDDWLPISDWLEQFLSALLRWPGCIAPDDFDWVEDGMTKSIECIKNRIDKLEKDTGRSTGMLMLQLRTKHPMPVSGYRSFRACVVQTVIPCFEDFPETGNLKGCDFQFDGTDIRRRHRNHLSSVLAAVKRMLTLRETYRNSDKEGDGVIDCLILPELAVHPIDVRTHLIPFARTHKTIILAGLTYERLLIGQPLVNSALWIIPEWSKAHGLQIKTRRQGKKHLAPEEQKYNRDTELLRGFRPCQWLVGYPWSSDKSDDPLWLTASICYDATDIGLVADLKNSSDVFAIPAMNKDIKTFDQMAMALHYHMFQYVVVANKGQYGGSNAYVPKKQEYERQVFHSHGQQTSISFFEIDDIQTYLRRYHDAAFIENSSSENNIGPAINQWKYPPAGSRF